MRISTTTLEEFRLWEDPDQEWLPESDLIATIKGEAIATPKMLVGQAFGRCLERPGHYVVPGGYSVPVKSSDGWQRFFFSEETMNPCFAKFDRRGVFEAKATKEYGDVTVAAKADQILGARIIENKCKLDSSYGVDFDNYAASYQWRFEFDLFEGALALTYNIFLLDTDGDTFKLKGIESFDLYPYPELHNDCAELVRRFKSYVIQRGLDGFLREREKTMQAAGWA